MKINVLIKIFIQEVNDPSWRTAGVTQNVTSRKERYLSPYLSDESIIG